MVVRNGNIQQDNQRNLITIIIWHLSFAVQTNERSIRWQNLISTCRYTFKYFYKMCFNIQCNVRCCHFSQPSHLDYFLPVFYDLLALHVITTLMMLSSLGKRHWRCNGYRGRIECGGSWFRVKQHPNYKDISPCLHNCNENYLHIVPINHDRNDHST
jgi:hypothetical protein